MDNLRKDMQIEDNYISKIKPEKKKKKEEKMSLGFNLKGKNDTDNKTIPKKHITLKNQQNYVNIQCNIDTTEINDLSDDEATFLEKIHYIQAKV